MNTKGALPCAEEKHTPCRQLRLSLPEDWNYTTRGLTSLSKDGVDSVGKALRELELEGYIIRRTLRNEKGRISDTEYTIYENPQKLVGCVPNKIHPNTGKPHTEKPDTENPDTVKPDTDNPAQLITKESNTDKSNTDLPVASGGVLERPEPQSAAARHSK